MEKNKENKFIYFDVGKNLAEIIKNIIIKGGTKI